MADQGNSPPPVSPSALRGQSHFPTGTRHSHSRTSYPGGSAHFFPPVHLCPVLVPGPTGSSALLSLQPEARVTELWRWNSPLHLLPGAPQGEQVGSAATALPPACGCPAPAQRASAVLSLLEVPLLRALRRWAEAGAAAAAREGEGVINNPPGGTAGGADGDPRRPQGARGRPADPAAPNPGSAGLDRPLWRC